MNKAILGIDIGHDNMKLVLVKGEQIRRTVRVALPDNLEQNGRIVSVETGAELITKALKENKIHASQAALILSSDEIIVRDLIMPQMTAKQLQVNLPYEFRDFITEDLNHYIYDYAMIAQEVAAEDGRAEGRPSMELFACAAPEALLNEYRDMIRKTGMKLVKAVPTLSTYIALIRTVNSAGEYCIVDLGATSVRMHMFTGDKHSVSRQLEDGIQAVVNVIAELYGVDTHLARTYLETDFEHCQSRAECMEVYENIAVELQRAVNFYRFSNPESSLNDIWVCGGGTAIPALLETIENRLGLRFHKINELMNGWSEDDAYDYAQAYGVTQD